MGPDGVDTGNGQQLPGLSPTTPLTPTPIPPAEPPRTCVISDGVSLGPTQHPLGCLLTALGMKGIQPPPRLLGKQDLNSDPSLPQNGQPRPQPSSLRSGVQEALDLESRVQTLTPPSDFWEPSLKSWSLGSSLLPYLDLGLYPSFRTPGPSSPFSDPLRVLDPFLLPQIKIRT